MDKANPKSSRNLIKPELSWHNYTNPLSGEFTLLNKPFAELTYSERILVVDYALFKLEAKVDNRSRFDFNNSSFSALMNKDTLKVINDAIGQVQDETNKSDYLSLANYLGIDAKQFNRPALKKLRKSLVVYLQKHPIRERNDNDELIPNVIKLPFTSQTPPVESSKKKKKPDHVFRDMEPPPDNASYSGAAKIDLFSFKYLGKKSSSTLRSKLIEEKSRRKNRFKLYRSQFDSDNKYWMYNNELAVLKNSIRTYNSNTR